MLASVDEIEPVEDKHGLEEIAPHPGMTALQVSVNARTNFAIHWIWPGLRPIWCGVLDRRIVHAKMVDPPASQIWPHLLLESVEGDVSLCFLVLHGFVITGRVGRDEQARIELLLAGQPLV